MIRAFVHFSMMIICDAKVVLFFPIVPGSRIIIWIFDRSLPHPDQAQNDHKNAGNKKDRIAVSFLWDVLESNQ